MKKNFGWRGHENCFIVILKTAMLCSLEASQLFWNKLVICQQLSTALNRFGRGSDNVMYKKD